MLSRDRFVVYGGTGHHDLDEDVRGLMNKVTNLGLRFSHIWHNRWPDGEPARRLETFSEIAGRHVIVFACVISDKLELELRDIVVACKHQYSAMSVTVVMSSLRYRRQDHTEKQEEITRLRWFLRDLKHWGADRLVICEPHSVRKTQQFCDEFGLRLSISDPTSLFSDAIRPVTQVLGQDKVRIYSPDLGSVGRAIELAKSVNAQVVATPKKRINDRVEDVDDDDFLGLIHRMYDVTVPISCDLSSLANTHVFMREDELSTARTAVTRADLLRKHGVASARLIATHPVCAWGWKTALFPYGESQPFDGIWLGNTRPRGVDETDYEGKSGGRATTVDIAPAIAETLIEVLKQITD